MKFKPYEFTRNNEEAKKVLVTKPEDVPKISIITLTRDGLDLIKKCWVALNKNTSYPNWEWIVGDSDSKDGTIEYIKELKDPRIKLVERKTTEGTFSSINNELVKFAGKTDYLLFLNNDTEPLPFWLYHMISKIHNHEEIGIVGARLLYKNGNIQHAGIGFMPQGPGNLGKSVLKSFQHGFAEHDRYYQAVTGACLLIRKKDFDAVGGFDEKLFWCYDDMDLCLKICYNLNKKVLYSSNAILYHDESVTQKKFGTSGPLQHEGIRYFKDKWMNKVELDFVKYQKDIRYKIRKIDLSFVTCVNDVAKYRNLVLFSLFKSKTKKVYEVIPILNFGNIYSAAKALNTGLDLARGDLVVFNHQDCLFYEKWIDILYERISEIEKTTKKWGVLGTAGIDEKDNVTGIVYSLKGKVQWTPTRKEKVFPAQTLDEHCVIIKKSNGLRFDEKTFTGFHFYACDLALNCKYKGMINFGILNPLVHDTGSGSLWKGEDDFMKQLNTLAMKWKNSFPYIRTTTSVINGRSVKTFIKFKKDN